MRVKAFLAWLAAFLASGPAASTEQPQCVERVRPITRLTKVDLPKPVIHNDAYHACFNQGRMDILSSITDLSPAEKALCGDQLVPLKDNSCDSEAIKMLRDETTTSNTNIVHQALNLSSGRWSDVSMYQEFACVLCEHGDVTYPLTTADTRDNLTTSDQFVAHLVNAEIQYSDEVGLDEKDRLTDALDKLLKPDFGRGFIKFDSAWLDKGMLLHIDFQIDTRISSTVPTGIPNERNITDNYLMTLEDVNSCPAGETVDADGVITQWPTTMMDSFTIIAFSTGAIVRRDCSFNWDTSRAGWIPLLSQWELVWRNCTAHEHYLNEEDYKPLLDALNVDNHHVNVLQELASMPVNTATLQEVARHVDRNLNGRNDLTVQLLINITAHLVMDSGSDYSVATAGRVDLIVVDLGGSDPVVGFALDFSVNSYGGSDVVSLNRKPTVKGEERALFALDVSSRLTEAHTRMAFLVLWKDTSPESTELFRCKYKQYIEVTVMFPRQGEVSELAFTANSDHHVDITYDKAKFLDHQNYGNASCGSWSNDLKDWTKEGCKTLYEGNFSACRCSGKYFALQDGVPVAKFALKPFNDTTAANYANALECLSFFRAICFIIYLAIIFKD